MKWAGKVRDLCFLNIKSSWKQKYFSTYHFHRYRVPPTYRVKNWKRSFVVREIGNNLRWGTTAVTTREDSCKARNCLLNTVRSSFCMCTIYYRKEQIRVLCRDGVECLQLVGMWEIDNNSGTKEGILWFMRAQLKSIVDVIRAASNLNMEGQNGRPWSQRSLHVPLPRNDWSITRSLQTGPGCAASDYLDGTDLSRESLGRELTLQKSGNGIRNSHWMQDFEIAKMNRRVQLSVVAMAEFTADHALCVWKKYWYVQVSKIDFSRRAWVKKREMNECYACFAHEKKFVELSRSPRLNLGLSLCKMWLSHGKHLWHKKCQKWLARKTRR